MDIKKQLIKIEECKKDIQKKELIKSLCDYLSKPKNQKTLEQISKYNYEKTIQKLYTNKEYDLFLQILTSIIQYIPSLSDQYLKEYQKTILDLIVPKIENNVELIKINFNYFLIATKDLNDISNIKHKEYLIYYIFFNILLKLKIEPNIIDLLLKLEKYMSRYQYELILYILIIYTFINKKDNPEDICQQMLIIPKIIEFCKIHYSVESAYLKNYDIMKNLYIMLLLYSPFKQEVLNDFYYDDPNLFMNLIQDIINYIDNNFRDLYINDQEDNNSFYYKYCDKDNGLLININHFFSDDLLESDFDNLCENKNILYNYFNNKTPLINEYKSFINKIDLKEIQEKNKYNVFKGIIWTLSSLIIKNYYSPISEENKDTHLMENKNHCLRLFNSLISLFQFIESDKQKIFIIQYLELIKSLLNKANIFEEWNYILDLINLCLDSIIKKDETLENIEKQYKKELKELNEIFINIFNIYNKNGLLYCDLEYLSFLLHKFNRFLEKDFLLCFYINIYLIHEHNNKKNIVISNFKNDIYANFINNIEKVVFNIFCSSHKSNSLTKNYLMEIIRVNYIYDSKIKEKSKYESGNKNTTKDNKSLITKQVEIEKVLTKYLENFFISFGDNEINYIFFNYVLTEILCKSSNVEFVKLIITTLIFNNNSDIDRNLYDNFIDQILRNLFENTINYSSKYVSSKEKSDFLLNFFYDMNNMNDKSILKIALKLLKCFIVNNMYEVLFVNKNYYNDYVMSNINYNHRHSMLVIDYNFTKIQKYKKKFKDEKEYEIYHKNYYTPFSLFEHIELFSALNYHLANNIKKKEIFESILEFYYLCLNKNLYFLKSINFKEFLNILLKEKDITKISSSKKITDYILKILSCLPYLLQNELDFSSSNNIIMKIKNSSYGNNDIQLIVDPKFKISAINCLINFWNFLNSTVATSLNKIFSNEQLTQTLFNSNRTYNESTIKNIVDKLMKKGDSYLWCGELDLYTQFKYIYNCIIILKMYLISNINEILLVKKNSINYGNYNEKNLKEKINLLYINNSNAISTIKSIILKIFTQIFNSLNYKYFNKKYSFFILSLLYEIKEFITLFILKDENQNNNINNTKKSFSNSNLNSQYNNMIIINEEKENEGLTIIFKTIFISMFLSWNYEDKIIEKFDKYLNTNYKMKILSKEKYIPLEKYYKEKYNFAEGIDNLIENLSDNLNIYLMEYIPKKYTSTLINIIDEVFVHHTNYREYFFYKMSEWTLKIKKNRDALNIDYRNIYDTKYLNNISSYIEDQYIGEKILNNSQIFYGNSSLIIINPITTTKFCFTLRNPISHMNLIFDSNMPIINNANIKEEIDKEFEDEEEDNEKNESNDLKRIEISNSFSIESEEFNKNDDEIIPEFLRANTRSDIKSKYNLKEENVEKKSDVNSFEFDDSSEEDMFTIQRKKSENNINKNYEINNNFKNVQSNVEKKSSSQKNNQDIFKRHRYHSDLGTKYKESILFSEQKKKIKENCLKLFSIMTELTDYKIEQYKWLDVTKNNNLHNITKLVQNLDLLPVFFCYNCGLIYYYKGKNDPNCIASYMYFIEKLGILFDYYDFYAEKYKNISKLINKKMKKEKYIIINQDSLIRINFHILNLTEKDENKIIEDNNIIFIWVDSSNKMYDFNINVCKNKIKIFFIITKITENFYKIQRKNNLPKNVLVETIDDLFVNDFIIDIENQSSVQLLLNMIIQIEILIKTFNRNLNIKMKKGKLNLSNEINDNNNINNIMLDYQNILDNDDHNNPSVNNINNNLEDKENYLIENDIKDDNVSSFKKRYDLINKLCQN